MLVPVSVAVVVKQEARKRRAVPVAAVVAGAVAVGVVVAALHPPEGEGAPEAEPAQSESFESPATKTVPLVVDAGTAVPAALPADGEDGAPPAPCDGCLDERSAIACAEEILQQEEVAYTDIRAELLADIPWYDPADRDNRRRPWPDDLLDAPTDWRLGPSLPDIDRPGETWVVRYQVGWLHPDTIESYILIGRLPPVARAWPPVKLEDVVLLDARNGEQWLDYHEIGRRESAARAEADIASGIPPTYDDP